MQTNQESEQNPTVAALLSALGLIIPLAAGAGQLYNGDVARGIVVSVVQIINAVLIFFLIGFATYPLWGLYAIYDAYKGPDAPLYDLV